MKKIIAILLTGILVVGLMALTINGNVSANPVVTDINNNILIFGLSVSIMGATVALTLITAVVALTLFILSKAPIILTETELQPHCCYKNQDDIFDDISDNNRDTLSDDLLYSPSFSHLAGNIYNNRND